jgi:hypothetical protein
MTSLTKGLVGATAGAGILGGLVVSASAAIVCSGHICWHSTETYEYPPRAHVVVHPDDWHWGPREHFVFREHEGRGYWHGTHWTGW